jgi:hypothetical protein
MVASVVSLPAWLAAHVRDGAAVLDPKLEAHAGEEGLSWPRSNCPVRIPVDRLLAAREARGGTLTGVGADLRKQKEIACPAPRAILSTC